MTYTLHLLQLYKLYWTFIKTYTLNYHSANMVLCFAAADFSHFVLISAIFQLHCHLTVLISVIYEVRLYFLFTLILYFTLLHFNLPFISPFILNAKQIYFQSMVIIVLYIEGIPKLDKYNAKMFPFSPIAGPHPSFSPTNLLVLYCFFSR